MTTRRRTLLKVIILGDSREEFLIQATPSDPDNFPFVVIGNEINVDGGNSRVVSEKKARAWCASKGNISYYETSVKEGTNVEDTFLCITKDAKRVANRKKCRFLDFMQLLFCGPENMP
ncbi:unnamed protein product [Eruca vesicaria subsp. sativa]|uniref:Uncharacterized protein n=1 Tax=Eruca vesicaria subsp. sativa TaxID=29727 RepID=A0ABC8JVP4_ERUVS|nr:unnamed protein product [Eruca vesicaria subsp. sativa]